MIETFLESDWNDDASEARRARDQRLTELQAQGYDCRTEDLSNILTGRQIYLLEATEGKPVELSPTGQNSGSRQRVKLKDASPQSPARPHRVARAQHYETL